MKERPVVLRDKEAGGYFVSTANGGHGRLSGAGLLLVGRVEFVELRVDRRRLWKFLAFLDQKGMDQQEKLSGRVAWVKPWEKGYLIGVIWDQILTKEMNPRLYSLLDVMLKESA